MLVVPNPQATKSALEKCKDHFNAAGATGSNRTPFAVALFFCGQKSGSFALGRIQSFSMKESEWLKGFCIYHLESH